MMNINWEVEDGYVGGSRPQSFEIDDEDITSCLTVEEAMEMIADATQEEFDNKASWCYRDFDRLKEAVKGLVESST